MEIERVVVVLGARLDDEGKIVRVTVPDGFIDALERIRTWLRTAVIEIGITKTSKARAIKLILNFLGIEFHFCLNC